MSQQPPPVSPPQTPSQPISEPFSARIPSASKLKQYRLCPRSVIDTTSVSVPRQKADVNSPAYVGQMLHQCLEVYINGRINLKWTIKQAYSEALEQSKKLGVMGQFCQMDKDTIEFMTGRGEAEVVMTELPLICSIGPLSVRRDTYQSIKPTDILVGTADVVIANKDGSYVIADWKTGMDDVDPPAENDQLLGLAWMAQQYFHFKEFYLAVVNPITKQGARVGPFTSAVFNLPEFLSTDKMKESAGDHCRYCPLRPDCCAFADMARKEVIYAGFQDPYGIGTREP